MWVGEGGVFTWLWPDRGGVKGGRGGGIADADPCGQFGLASWPLWEISIGQSAIVGNFHWLAPVSYFGWASLVKFPKWVIWVTRSSQWITTCNSLKQYHDKQYAVLAYAVIAYTGSRFAQASSGVLSAPMNIYL